MVHRDPQTGQFVAGDDDGNMATEWSDYEVVNARWTAGTGGGQAGFDSGNTEGFPSVVDDMIPGEELERDEYAELVQLYRQAVFYVEDYDGQNQTQRGHAVGDWNILINNEPETEVLSDDIDPGFGRLENRHYGGVVDSGVLATRPQASSNDVNSAASGEYWGAGGDVSATEREVNFRNTLGGGPVVDRFDDIKFVSGFQKSNTLSSATLEVEAILYFDVQQVEDSSPFRR